MMFDLRKIFAVPKDFLKSKIYCNAFEGSFYVFMREHNFKSKLRLESVNGEKFCTLSHDIFSHFK